MLKLTLTFLLLFTSTLAMGADVQAGPNGGRLLTGTTPHAEFFVTSERRVQITFISEAGQPVSPADQIVKVTTGDRSAPTTLTFSPSGSVLLSDAVLPDGNGFPTVVQIKSDPSSATDVSRFYLNMIVCSGCDNGEYACICGH